MCLEAARPRRSRPRLVAVRRALRRSAWATWGCRFRSSSRRAGLDVTGLDLAEAKVEAVNRGDSYVKDVSSERLAGVVQAGKLRATQRLRGARQLGRHRHLRPDAAQQDPRSGSVDGGRGLQGDRVAPARRSARRPREHDLSGHHRRADPAAALRARAGGGGGLLPGLLAGARRSGQPTLRHPQHPEDHRRRDAGLHARGARALPSGDRDGDPGLLHAHRRDGQAAREHLPQRQHRPRQRGRADVRSARASTSGR